MNADELFESALAKAHSKYAVITIGKGVAKEVTEHSCIVERAGRPELFDVIFHASENLPENHISVIPKEGSEVVYGILENQPTEAVILQCSEIERVIIKTGSAIYQVNSDGHAVKKGDDSAAKIISDLIDEINKIIVINGRSPNVPAITAIKERVNNLFK